MVHKDPKPKHHHKPAIERTLPMEQIIALFAQRFDEPYLNPMAELTFEAFVNAFPNITRDVLEEALSYWTSHSGEKLLQTKTVEGIIGDNRVWYIHGLRPHLDEPATGSAKLGSH